MKQFKLHLQIPKESANHWGKIAAWKAENDKLIEVLSERMNLIHESFLAGTVLEEMYSEKEIKDLCLQVYGSDWPSQVAKIAKLRLIGNGPCPFCGCDQATENMGSFERDDQDQLYQNVRSYTCMNCKTEYEPNQN